MPIGARTLLAVVVAWTMVGTPGRAFADEADNFTCRARLSRDALGSIDALMNDRIEEVVARANRRAAACDAGCLVRELQASLGSSYPSPLTLIPHSRLAQRIGERPDIERCHLAFHDTIYGARPYNQPWLVPFTGRIILVADSILLSGRVIGLDKFDHFIREGLVHWRTVQESGDIATSIAREVGRPDRPLAWTEYGLKGMSMTGVFAYADLAAGYSGFRFWNDVLSVGQSNSFVAQDGANHTFTKQRVFTFADYVNDAWDEGINRSVFHPALNRDIDAALLARSIRTDLNACRTLVSLPDARLYVNPACLTAPLLD